MLSDIPLFRWWLFRSLLYYQKLKNRIFFLKNLPKLVAPKSGTNIFRFIKEKLVVLKLSAFNRNLFIAEVYCWLDWARVRVSETIWSYKTRQKSQLCNVIFRQYFQTISSSLESDISTHHTVQKFGICKMCKVKLRIAKSGTLPVIKVKLRFDNVVSASSKSTADFVIDVLHWIMTVDAKSTPSRWKPEKYRSAD